MKQNPGRWKPTSKNINALPKPVRNYIYELETNSDPASLVRENILLKDNIQALERKLYEMSLLRKLYEMSLL